MKLKSEMLRPWKYPHIFPFKKQFLPLEGKTTLRRFSSASRPYLFEEFSKERKVKSKSYKGGLVCPFAGQFSSLLIERLFFVKAGGVDNEHGKSKLMVL